MSPENRDIPSEAQTFSILDISDTLKGCSTIFFDTLRQKIFDGKFQYPHPFLSINFFATRFFLKHSIEGFLYEMFRYCEPKVFVGKS